MGTPGSRSSTGGDAAATRYVERLDSVGGTTKKMFGGHGLFADGRMFGMVTGAGDLAFKADEASRETYEAAGSARQGKIPYWRVPDAVLDDDEALLAWAREAIAGAAKP